MVKRLTGLAVLALGMSALTACSPGVAPADPRSNRIVDSSENASRSASRAVGNECGDPMQLRSDDAIPPRGSTLSTTSVLPGRSSDAIVRAISPSGEVLREIGRDDDPATGADSLHPGVLSVLDPETGESETVRGPGDVHDGTQTTFAALDDEHAVWLEQTSTDLTSSDWTMYAANRETGETSRVAKARPVDGSGLPPAAPGYTIPSLAGGEVYWSETRPASTSGEPPVVNVYARTLDSSEPAKLVVENAVNPVATGDWLYYIGFEADEFHDTAYTVYRKRLSTGETTVIHESKGSDSHSIGKAAFLTAYDDTVAWSLAESVRVFRGTEPVAEVVAPDELLVWLSAGPGSIGFEDGSGSGAGRNYLLDLDAGCLHNLGDGEGAAEVKIGGNHVLWSMPSGSTETVWHYATLR